MEENLNLLFQRYLNDNKLTAGEKLDRLCTVIPCAISLFGTFIIITSIISFKKLQTITFYMVGLQAISESIFNTGRIIFYTPPNHNDWRCKFQGCWINYGIMSSIFFSGSIAGHMYLMITRRTYKLTQTGLIKLTLVIFFSALGLALIPLSTNQYQNIGAECWIAGQGEYGTTVKNGTIMRFATHYSLIWAICLFCAWCYITIFKYIQELREALRMSVKTVDGERSEVEKTVHRLQYYPAILIFVWLPITACRIYSSIYPDRYLANWALGGSHTIVNSQGWLNAIVFCSYSSVYNCWLKVFGFKLKTKSPVTSSNPRLQNNTSSGGTNDSDETGPQSRLISLTNTISNLVSFRNKNRTESLLSADEGKM